jgi:hypothetical protein
MLDPHSDSSLDSYWTIQPQQTPEGVLTGVTNEGKETWETLGRSGEKSMVPKPGLYQTGLLKWLISGQSPCFSRRPSIAVFISL